MPKNEPETPKPEEIKIECLNCGELFSPARNPRHTTWGDVFCCRRCEGDYYAEDE